MLPRVITLLFTSIFSFALITIPQYCLSSEEIGWEQVITIKFNSHISFFTALYLLEAKKAVRVPCIFKFVEAVKKEILDPKHNAPFLSERGEQLIKQLERMYINSEGHNLLAQYRNEGKSLFIELVFSQSFKGLPC